MRQRTFYAIVAVFVILIVVGAIWKDNSKILGFHPNGKAEIVWVEYWEGGHRWRKEMSFYPNGQKQYECYYRDKLRQGRLLEWDWDGDKISEAFFDQGKPVGTHRIWFRNGVLNSITSFQNGLMHGEYRYFWGNRRLQVGGTYFHGEKHGRWVTYSSNGKVEKEEFFDQGKPAKETTGHE
jgi:antitoxin component YwqK of YwqJK toxin-antitoxin module